MRTLLEGKKTYIIAVLAAIDAFGQYMGYWQEDRFRDMAEMILFGVALRAGVTKSGT